MSEVKQNIQNCSIKSPCENDYICDLDNNKCEPKVNKLTFHIKNKSFSGDTETVFKKIQQEYSKIITTAKCDWGMHMTTLQDYTGESYTKFQQSLKKGKLLAFYNPTTDKILCQSRYDLLQYWQEKRNTFRGIILTEREIKYLKSNPDKSAYISASYKKQKRQEYFIPLSPLTPTIYIKQSQYYNILKKGHSFFAIVPTSYTWIDTIQPDISAYHNYNPGRGEYGDTLYLIVPLSNSVQSEYNTLKKEIEKIYCKNRPSYVTSQPMIMKTSQDLLKELSLIYKEKLSVEGQRLRKSLGFNLRELQSLKKTSLFPYWYNINDPMGKILQKILKKNPQGPILSNIKFSYNMYPIQPVYIDNNMGQFLVCQTQDLDYETRLYVLVIDDGNKIYPGYFSQNLENLVNYAKNKESVTFYTSLIRLNKYFKPNLTELPTLSIKEYKRIAEYRRLNREITKNSPIYGVVEIFKHNQTEMVICGTSIKAMKKYYNTIIENKYSIGKLLVNLKMDTPFDGNYFSQNIIEKEMFDNDEEDEEDEKKEDSMSLQQYITRLSQQLVDYGRNLTREYDLSNDPEMENLITELKDEFLSGVYETKEEATHKFNYYKSELDRIIVEYSEMDLSDL